MVEKAMKCPYCEGNMKKGIIKSDRFSLKWIPEEENKGPVNSIFSKGIKLSNVLQDYGAEAFFCGNCKKVIIDVNDKDIK